MSMYDFGPISVKRILQLAESDRERLKETVKARLTGEP